MNALVNIYCENCGTLLGKLDGRAELKCRKCGRIAVYESEKTLKNAEFDREVIKTRYFNRLRGNSGSAAEKPINAGRK